MSDDAVTKDKATKEKPDLVRLRAEIQLTRAELGETVQALAAKADVKARAREQIDQTKTRALGRLDEVRTRVRANPMPLALVGAGLAAIAGVVLILNGRRK